LQPLNAVEDGTTPGLRLFACTLETRCAVRSLALGRLAFWGDGALFGNGPQAPHELPRHRHHPLGGVFPPRHQAAGAFAPAHLGCPTDVLDGFGVLCASSLPVATDVRGLPIRPGAFDQHAPGMAMTRCGDGALTTPVTRGVVRGNQAQELHEWSGISNAGAVAECSDHGDGHRERDTAQGSQGLDHRRQAPGADLLVELLFEPLEAFGVLGDRPHLFWEDDWRRGGGTHHRGKPPERGWAPRGPAGIATIMPEPEGVQAELCCLAILDGIFTGTGEVADGCIVHGGDMALP
jgi:hypothetical protein